MNVGVVGFIDVGCYYIGLVVGGSFFDDVLLGVVELGGFVFDKDDVGGNWLVFEWKFV